MSNKGLLALILLGVVVLVGANTFYIVNEAGRGSAFWCASQPRCQAGHAR